MKAMTRLDDARMRLAEANGRLIQAEEMRSEPAEQGYYLREAGQRLAESIEAIVDWLDEKEWGQDG